MMVDQLGVRVCGRSDGSRRRLLRDNIVPIEG